MVNTALENPVTARLPDGTLALLFTDIEDSTALLRRLGPRYADVLAQHRQILRAAAASNAGEECGTEGDAFFFVFPGAVEAVMAAVGAQKQLAEHRWPTDGTVRVRMGVHIGEPMRTSEGFVGLAIHRAARLCAAAHGGQVLLSGIAASVVCEAPPDGIDLTSLGMHHLRGFEEADEVFQLVLPDMPAQFPPLRVADTPRTNLSSATNTFIGRESDVKQIEALLNRGRLVSVLGPGGVGKTRLAEEVARRHVGEVWWVELERVTQAAQVLPAVADVLHVGEQPGRSLLEHVSDAIGSRELLLILDNCEHLIDPCASLAAQLLRACPALRLLVTSRESLRIAGEHLWSLDPLPVPPIGSFIEPAQIMEYPAARLFIERAMELQPGFQVTVANHAAIATICRRLDGLPLAIELAAARARALPVEEMVRRMDRRLGVLGRGDRSALERHQTLDAAIDWSYEVLTPAEQRLFYGLTVFTGGFTLAAAEAVCDGSVGLAEQAPDTDPGRDHNHNHNHDGGDVLDLLVSLVDKSLVVVPRMVGGVLRYHMLETLQVYGRSRLAESGEAEAMSARHAAFFADWSNEANTYLEGPEQAAWLELIDAERDNCLSALDWAARHDHHLALCLAGNLGPYWSIRGYLTAGREQLSAVLALPSVAADPACFEALTQAARLARQQADYSAATDYLAEALDLCRESGDDRSTAGILRELGVVADSRGDHATAERRYAESLSEYKRLGDRRGAAAVLNNLGILAHHQGWFDRARAYLEESLAIFRALGEPLVVGIVLSNLANVAGDEGQYGVAEALYEEALEIARSLGDQPGIGVVLSSLAYVRLRQGARGPAQAALVEALRVLGALNDRLKLAECLGTLALLLEAEAQPADAARVLGAEEALFEELDVPILAKEQAEHDALVARLSAALGPEVYAKSWNQGRGEGWATVVAAVTTDAHRS